MAGEEHDDPVDRLLDLFVYAPIGLLATGGEHLDDYIAKGRERATVARTVGQFALKGVDERIVRSMVDLEGMAREFLRVVVANASPRDPRRTAGARSDDESPRSTAGAASSIDDLIAGYDDLTAREILPLLDALDDEALARVESHERSGRNRSTVLARLRRARG